MKKIVAFVFSFVIISWLFSIRIMHPLGFGCTCPVVDNFYTPINLFAIAASSVILTGIFGEFSLQSITLYNSWWRSSAKTGIMLKN